MRIGYTPEQEELRRELRAYFTKLMTPERAEALSSSDGSRQQLVDLVVFWLLPGNSPSERNARRLSCELKLIAIGVKVTPSAWESRLTYSIWTTRITRWLSRIRWPPTRRTWPSSRSQNARAPHCFARTRGIH